MSDAKKSGIKPVLSEKAYGLAKTGVYTFVVPRSMNKIEIGKRVAEEYKVEVDSVRVLTKPGKMKRDYKTYKTYRRSDKKYAYVKLKANQEIKGIYE